MNGSNRISCKTRRMTWQSLDGLITPILTLPSTCTHNKLSQIQNIIPHPHVSQPPSSSTSSCNLRRSIWLSSFNRTVACNPSSCLCNHHQTNNTTPSSSSDRHRSLNPWLAPSQRPTIILSPRFYSLTYTFPPPHKSKIVTPLDQHPPRSWSSLSFLSAQPTTSP